METTEKRFESDIESALLSPPGGYVKGSDTYDPDYTDNMDEDQAPDTSDTDTATVDSEAKSSATKKRRRRRRRKPTAASDTSSDAGDPSQE